MESNPIRFSCVGCGVCCTGRLIPLTLTESLIWLRRGHEVAVILEAFQESMWPSTADEFEHSAGRSAEVRCGDTKVRVIAIFAANAIERCPNLQADNLCGIYEERPLVCRIYPMEINPFIALNKDNKVCPPESWESDQILYTDRVVDLTLVDQINKSRQADRADALTKVAICEYLGFNVAAWKGNAFAIYLPERTKLLEAILNQEDEQKLRTDSEWQVRVVDADLYRRLNKTGLALDDSTDVKYLFHKL